MQSVRHHTLPPRTPGSSIIAFWLCQTQRDSDKENKTFFPQSQILWEMAFIKIPVEASLKHGIGLAKVC